VTDEDLRMRLQRADPATSLPSLAPASVERLLGETMTTTESATRHGWRRLVPAAAVLVLLTIGLGYLFSPSANPAPKSADPGGSSSPTVTDLTLGGAAAKCREPQAAQLADAADFAFAGSVTTISGNVVTLRVEHVYRGAPTAEVRVAQQGEYSESILGSGVFEIDKNYLVSSSEGSVLICGYSGEADSPGLQQLYDHAF